MAIVKFFIPDIWSNHETDVIIERLLQQIESANLLDDLKSIQRYDDNIEVYIRKKSIAQFLNMKIDVHGALFHFAAKDEKILVINIYGLELDTDWTSVVTEVSHFGHPVHYFEYKKEWNGRVIKTGVRCIWIKQMRVLSNCIEERKSSGYQHGSVIDSKYMKGEEIGSDSNHDLPYKKGYQLVQGKSGVRERRRKRWRKRWNENDKITIKEDSVISEEKLKEECSNIQHDKVMEKKVLNVKENAMVSLNNARDDMGNETIVTVMKKHKHSAIGGDHREYWGNFKSTYMRGKKTLDKIQNMTTETGENYMKEEKELVDNVKMSTLNQNKGHKMVKDDDKKDDKEKGQLDFKDVNNFITRENFTSKEAIENAKSDETEETVHESDQRSDGKTDLKLDKYIIRSSEEGFPSQNDKTVPLLDNIEETSTNLTSGHQRKGYKIIRRRSSSRVKRINEGEESKLKRNELGNRNKVTIEDDIKRISKKREIFMKNDETRNDDMIIKNNKHKNEEKNRKRKEAIINVKTTELRFDDKVAIEYTKNRVEVLEKDVGNTQERMQEDKEEERKTIEERYTKGEISSGKEVAKRLGKEDLIAKENEVYEKVNSSKSLYKDSVSEINNDDDKLVNGNEVYERDIEKTSSALIRMAYDIIQNTNAKNTGYSVTNILRSCALATENRRRATNTRIKPIENTGDKITTGDIEQDVFTCKICSKEFTTQEYLDKHSMRSHRNFEVDDESQNNIEFIVNWLDNNKGVSA